MNAAERLRRLYDYDRWANQQVFQVLKTNNTFEFRSKTNSLMSHIMAAEDLWYRRIEGHELSDLKVWPDYKMEEIATMIEEFGSRWQTLIKEYASDLDRRISYSNTSGTAYETMLSDILHHVIIHGQHHRAQIASWLRKADIAPPATDFIFYTRKQ